MPKLTAAQREQGNIPQPRFRIWCRYCAPPRYIGTAQNAHAAYLAGCRHFEERHDTERGETCLRDGFDHQRAMRKATA